MARKKNTITVENIDNIESEITGGIVEETPIKENKKESRTNKNNSVNIESIKQLLNGVFKIIATFQGKEYQYDESNFKTESESLKRLSEKYPPVKDVLNLFDPLLIIVNLFDKYIKLKYKKQNYQEDIVNVDTIT